jgi:tetratricopeptide (TPR) repeat protein
VAQEQPGPPITPADQEADLFFKVQMQLAHWVYGYWKQGLAGIGVVLFLTLVVGQTSTCLRDQQRDGSAAMAAVERAMPAPSPLAQYGLAPLDDLSDPEHVAQLEQAAQAYEDVANGSHRLAQAEAWLRAGNTWARAGNDERAGVAYEAAYDADRGGIYTYAAGNRLAMIHREAERVDQAAELYRDMSRDLKGYLAEQALLDLMGLRLDQGDSESIQRLAGEFRARFDTSPRLEQVQLIESKATSSGS